jgi:hypothetical protein
LAQREKVLAIPQTTIYIGVRASAGPPALLARSVGAALTAVNRDLVLAFQPLAPQFDESLACIV